jgi:hypothetical protein
VLLLGEMEEKYSSLVLQEQTKPSPAVMGGRGLHGNSGSSHGASGESSSTNHSSTSHSNTSTSGSSSGGGGLTEESGVLSVAFVQCLHEVAMVVAQDPKAELEDRIAGLELLRYRLHVHSYAS